MRSLHLLLISAGIIGAASLASQPASARQLSFKECQALYDAVAQGVQVGHGQEGTALAVGERVQSALWAQAHEGEKRPV